jgi:uncharacterized protein (DUF2062 family)
MLSNLLRGFRALLARAVSEHASPPKIALSVALGVFCASTPLIGFHLGMALGLATAFRLNRLWAAVGSRGTTGPLLPLVVFTEVQLAHRLRTGAWVPLAPHEALAHGKELMFDWVLGTPLVGGVYAAVVGVVAYALARQRQVTPGTLDESPPVSSESPRSVRPTPSG